MKLYIAGPMRGLPQFNFPAFMEAEKSLKAKGFAVYNPAAEDLREGFDPDKPGVITGERYELWMLRDLEAIKGVDGVCALPGWEKSEGARREIVHAMALGKWLFRYAADGLQLFDGAPIQSFARAWLPVDSEPCDECGGHPVECICGTPEAVREQKPEIDRLKTLCVQLADALCEFSENDQYSDATAALVERGRAEGKP